MSAYVSSGNLPHNDGELSISVGGQNITGWTSVRVTRGCERVPADFDIATTEGTPLYTSGVIFEPGMPCQISIGGDLVLTGYLDRYEPSVSASQHVVRLQGRSKSEDLVDCSAGVEADGTTTRGMTLPVSDLVELANQLASPFKVPVRSITGGPVPMTSWTGTGPIAINLILTETPYEVIERVARYVTVLVYDDPDGSLLIAAVGAGTMASGFTQGVNVQTAAVAFTMDQRYSIYLPTLMSIDSAKNVPPGSSSLFSPSRDLGVPRFRPLIVVSEQPSFGPEWAIKRANWEMMRRWGRSQALQVTCDSWRDSGGNLWTPNFFAPIDIPICRVQPSEPWIIGEVTYSRDLATGTTAHLTLMPKEAFVPQMSTDVAYDWQIGQRLGQGGGPAR